MIAASKKSIQRYQMFRISKTHVTTTK
jgi:hypothetical protein